MNVKVFAGLLAFVGVAAVAALTAMEPNAGPRQQGIVYFERPTQIAGHMVMGKTLIVHDDDRMARGEACTTVYRYTHGRTEEVVSFMCVPSAQPAAEKFIVRCAKNRFNVITDVLVDYQLPGEVEAHAVPQQ